MKWSFLCSKRESLSKILQHCDVIKPWDWKLKCSNNKNESLLSHINSSCSETWSMWFLKYRSDRRETTSGDIPLRYHRPQLTYISTFRIHLLYPMNKKENSNSSRSSIRTNFPFDESNLLLFHFLLVSLKFGQNMSRIWNENNFKISIKIIYVEKHFWNKKMTRF